jgi:hypothetical protein
MRKSFPLCACTMTIKCTFFGLSTEFCLSIFAVLLHVSTLLPRRNQFLKNTKTLWSIKIKIYEILWRLGVCVRNIHVYWLMELFLLAGKYFLHGSLWTNLFLFFLENLRIKLSHYITSLCFLYIYIYTYLFMYIRVCVKFVSMGYLK